MIESLKHIDWDKFHFLRPDYLWVAIPMAIILLLGVFAYSENNRWKKNIAKHLQPYVIQKGTEWKSRIVHLSLFFLFGFAFIAFLGPTWEEEKQPSKKLKSQLVIALDLSQSMLTTDISPTRLERAKFKIRDFLEANPRAETALKVFTASTHTVVPFTTDYKIILDHLDGLKPSMMPNKGTGFDNLFTHLDSLFVNNQAEGKILLITDDLEGLDVQNVSAFMQQNNVVLNVYPFSTKTGGNVPSFRNSKYALKVGGKEVLTALNTDVLQNLKTIENVHAIDLTLDKSDVTLLAEEISNNLIFEEKPDDEDENWKDNGYWLLIPILIVFLFSFRKGWAIYTIVLMIGFTSCGKMKENKDQNNFKFKNLWYTKAYQGQQAFDEGDYAMAATQFEDPMRKGISYFKDGDYLKAKVEFEMDSSNVGLYNLGLTYAKLGDLSKSKAIFELLVEKDPSFSKAKENLDNINQIMVALNSSAPEDAELNEEKPNAENEQNKSPEDLSGGGQEATKKDMEKERLEEEVETDKRKGKELDELPDDFESGSGAIPNNILMRKVDDDPSLFLTKKFKYQIKKKKVTAQKTSTEW